MLRWTERARKDLDAIGDYIAADNPAAARLWVEKLRQKAVRASRMPYAGRAVPELSVREVREVIHGTYRIIYRVIDDGIVVLTIFERHRVFGSVDIDDEQGVS